MTMLFDAPKAPMAIISNPLRSTSQSAKAPWLPGLENPPSRNVTRRAQHRDNVLVMAEVMGSIATGYEKTLATSSQACIWSAPMLGSNEDTPLIDRSKHH